MSYPGAARYRETRWRLAGPPIIIGYCKPAHPNNSHISSAPAAGCAALYLPFPPPLPTRDAVPPSFVVVVVVVVVLLLLLFLLQQPRPPLGVELFAQGARDAPQKHEQGVRS